MKTRLIVFVLLFLVSCETVVDNIPETRLPKTASKLVVHSFISPQNTQINVAVTESTPLFSDMDEKEDVIETALVKISDEVNEITIPFDPKTRLYSIDQSKFPIVASKTYTLHVSEGERVVTAHCQVPGNTPVIQSYSLDTTTGSHFSREDTALVLKMSWQDIPNDTNYYRVRAQGEMEYSVPDAGSAGKRTRSELDFSWQESSGHSEWQSDRNLDGSLFSSPTGKLFIPTFITPAPNSGSPPKQHDSQFRLIALTMMVYNSDVNYYKYHRSVQQRMDTENPLSEPSQIYSNIDGGLGCFGAYNAGKLIYRPE